MKKLLKGLLFGATVGGITTLLCAPRSGKETRKMIKLEAEEILANGTDFAQGIEKVAEHSAIVKVQQEKVLKPFVKETKQALTDFKFQATPRVIQIREQIEKMKQHVTK